MKIIALVSVIGILLLQWSGGIPLSSVGGPMAIALAYFGAALAVAIHEAWTMKRGAFGWIVNIVAVLVGVFVTAELGGIVMAFLLNPFMTGSSIAASGGGVMSAALVGGMVVALAGSWLALQIVNRWR